MHAYASVNFVQCAGLLFYTSSVPIGGVTSTACLGLVLGAKELKKHCSPWAKFFSLLHDVDDVLAISPFLCRQCVFREVCSIYAPFKVSATFGVPGAGTEGVRADFIVHGTLVGVYVSINECSALPRQTYLPFLGALPCMPKQLNSGYTLGKNTRLQCYGAFTGSDLYEGTGGHSGIISFRLPP
eukprot:157708-Amphidinium_carterae.1